MCQLIIFYAHLGFKGQPFYPVQTLGRIYTWIHLGPSFLVFPTFSYSGKGDLAYENKQNLSLQVSCACNASGRSWFMENAAGILLWGGIIWEEGKKKNPFFSYLSWTRKSAKSCREASSGWLIKAIQLFSLSKGLIRHLSILGTHGIAFVSSTEGRA